MNTLSYFLRTLDRFSRPATVYAHCDVPCGLYDIAAAKMAADTVAKMVEKINALSQDPSLENRNSFVRMVSTKEQHAELCKHELLILWTDFFKPEHLALFPNLHDTFWKAAKLCSYNKQTISVESAKELQEAVGKIGEMFYAAKAKAAQ